MPLRFTEKQWVIAKTKTVFCYQTVIYSSSSKIVVYAYMILYVARDVAAYP